MQKDPTQSDFDFTRLTEKSELKDITERLRAKKPAYVLMRPSDFYDAIRTEPNRSNQSSSGVEGRKGGYGMGKEWYGTSNFPEADKLARGGWVEGVKMVEPLARKISIELVKSLKKPSIYLDVTGQMFDMGRVMSGEPESWMEWSEVEGESTLGPVHIVQNIAVSGSNDKEVILRKGMAIVALVTVLEASGRKTKVEVTAPTKEYTERGGIETRVLVKDYYEDLQIDALAYAAMHPSSLRRHHFGMWERIDAITGSGYGILQEPFGPRGDIYLDGNVGRWREEDLRPWIIAQLKSQGVKFDL